MADKRIKKYLIIFVSGLICLLIFWYVSELDQKTNKSKINNDYKHRSADNGNLKENNLRVNDDIIIKDDLLIDNDLLTKEDLLAVNSPVIKETITESVKNLQDDVKNISENSSTEILDDDSQSTENNLAPLGKPNSQLVDKSLEILNINVPFTTQAPLIKWDDPRQQDGCEEAVAVMAMAWVKGEGGASKISPAEFEKRILALSDFQKNTYGEFRDTSLSDIISWIFQDYYSSDKAELKLVASTSDIISELQKGKIVLLPMAGRELMNPNFKAPGPLTHMILVKGYDYKTQEFITNDPGTRLGADYRYPIERAYRAINVYPTGYHLETKERAKAMIVISK